MTDNNDSQEPVREDIAPLLARIAAALEQQAGITPPAAPDWAAANAYSWQAQSGTLRPVPDTGALPLSLLVGLAQQAEVLLQNTRQFAAGYPANNALLWGARGMGKSALVKAAHKDVAAGSERPLILIEIQREDIDSLAGLIDLLRNHEDKRFLLFCDDLSFDDGESGYKSLKTLLEGGIAARPAHILFYATSNRRHPMPRRMIENERQTAIQPGEAVEEKVSLSDRFGLWLGFYPCTQEQFLAMIDNYATALGLGDDREELHRQALEWAVTRGGRSGRVAWQFIQDLAGKAQKQVNV